MTSDQLPIRLSFPHNPDLIRVEYAASDLRAEHCPKGLLQHGGYTPVPWLAYKPLEHVKIDHIFHHSDYPYIYVCW